MTFPTTPSSTPGTGVEVALEEVERAEADDRRAPGIAALYTEFMRTRTKTRPEQRHDDGGEEKLGEFWADRQRNSFATTAKDEEKNYSSHETTRGSSTGNRRPRQRRARSWNEGEEKGEGGNEKDDEKDDEKDHNIT